MSFLDDNDLPLKVVIRCYNSIILKAHSLSGMPNLSSKYDSYVRELDEVSSKLARATSSLKATGETIISAASPEMCKQLKNIHYVKVSRFLCQVSSQATFTEMKIKYF